MVDVPDISVVVPVYGSDSTLVPLYKRVATAISGIPASFELIFVDDCGPGNPWAIISKMAQNDPRVTGLKLSRNYGQHNAIMAGINLARGRWVVIMDCDLQDRHFPQKMYQIPLPVDELNSNSEVEQYAEWK